MVIGWFIWIERDYVHENYRSLPSTSTQREGWGFSCQEPMREREGRKRVIFDFWIGWYVPEEKESGAFAYLLFCAEYAARQ